MSLSCTQLAHLLSRSKPNALNLRTPHVSEPAKLATGLSSCAPVADSVPLGCAMNSTISALHIESYSAQPRKFAARGPETPPLLADNKHSLLSHWSALQNRHPLGKSTVLTLEKPGLATITTTHEPVRAYVDKLRLPKAKAVPTTYFSTK